MQFTVCVDNDKLDNPLVFHTDGVNVFGHGEAKDKENLKKCVLILPTIFHTYRAAKLLGWEIGGKSYVCELELGILNDFGRWLAAVDGILIARFRKFVVNDGVVSVEFDITDPITYTGFDGF